MSIEFVFKLFLTKSLADYDSFNIDSDKFCMNFDLKCFKNSALYERENNLSRFGIQKFSEINAKIIKIG